jgi:hypothetical protein
MPKGFDPGGHTSAEQVAAWASPAIAVEARTKTSPATKNLICCFIVSLPSVWFHDEP